MKRSTMVCLGAMGLVTAGWAVERAMRKPDCPIGPDGQRIITPDCRDPSRSGSSYSRSYYYGGSSSNSSGGFWGSSSSSHSTAGSVGGGSHAVSSGGWGTIGRAFSSGS